MPCGFQTMSDNSLRKKNVGGKFQVTSLAFLFGVRFVGNGPFRQRGRRPTVFRSAVLLFRLHDARRLPSAFSGRQNGSGVSFGQ